MKTEHVNTAISETLIENLYCVLWEQNSLMRKEHAFDGFDEKKYDGEPIGNELVTYLWHEGHGEEIIVTEPIEEEEVVVVVEINKLVERMSKRKNNKKRSRTMWVSGYFRSLNLGECQSRQAEQEPLCSCCVEKQDSREYDHTMGECKR